MQNMRNRGAGPQFGNSFHGDPYADPRRSRNSFHGDPYVDPWISGNSFHGDPYANPHPPSNNHHGYADRLPNNSNHSNQFGHGVENRGHPKNQKSKNKSKKSSVKKVATKLGKKALKKGAEEGFNNAGTELGVTDGEDTSCFSGIFSLCCNCTDENEDQQYEE